MSSSAIESYPDKVVNIKVIGVGGEQQCCQPHD